MQKYQTDPIIQRGSSSMAKKHGGAGSSSVVINVTNPTTQHQALLKSGSSQPLPDNNHCGSVWFIRDICGIICAIITYGLVLYAEFVVMFVILIPGPNFAYSIVNAIIFNALAFLAIASHTKTMLTDPGAVPKGNAVNLSPEELQKLGLLRDGDIILKCPKCASIKPERAHHCSICQRCIRKMDHHCPWVNNCVGENNQKYFVLFTMYIALISLHALGLVAGQAFMCMDKDWKECSGFSPPATVVLMMFLTFEGLLFSIFTVIMFITQVQAVMSDETGIEQLKREKPTWRKKSRWASMAGVCGGPFSISWFNPFTKPAGGSGKARVAMYDV